MPSTLPDPAPPPLDYGQAPHPLRRNRIKWAIRLSAAAALLIPTYALLAPRVEHRWQFLDAQRNWRTLTHAEGQWASFQKWSIVADTGLTSLRLLPGVGPLPPTPILQPPQGRLPSHPLSPLPPPLQPVPSASSSSSSPPTPAPHRRHSNITLTLNWYTGTPGGWFADPSNLTSGAATFPRPIIPAKGDTTFFSGQPDPADPAHFTLPYQIDGTKGVIDAHLLPDGKIDMKATTGPLAPH